MTDDHFAKYHAQTQETRNNYFGSKKRNKTLRQAKSGKHESRNVTATYKTKYSGKILIY